ncbi:MAG: hypothetical protein RIR05_795, partial [Bacteroidota bacterium]
NKECDKAIRFITKPIYWLRIGFGIFILIGLGTLFYSISLINISIENIIVTDFVQAAEASINDVIFIIAAIYFLFKAESKIKLNIALKNIQQLRIIAHVIDMHQLTKVPKSIISNATAHSPQRNLNNFELCRYLDYCSEMLSLTSKISAMFTNDYNDEVVLNSVKEIEALTTSLTVKVWQKIILINEG